MQLGQRNYPKLLILWQFLNENHQFFENLQKLKIKGSFDSQNIKERELKVLNFFLKKFNNKTKGCFISKIQKNIELEALNKIKKLPNTCKNPMLADFSFWQVSVTILGLASYWVLGALILNFGEKKK